ncbi:hypothetical protein ES708_10270 [subsurface metagenome]
MITISIIALELAFFTLSIIPMVIYATKPKSVLFYLQKIQNIEED